MFEAISGRTRVIGLGAVALTAALAFPGSALAADAPTFTKDIAPIFQEKCEACHRPDSIAPMSLKTYAETRPWARSIKARVADRQMPPWHIDKTVGIQKFKNDRSLSDDQIDTIVRWVDAGAPQGDLEGHAGRQAVARRSGLEFRRAVRPERAGHGHQVLRLHHAGGVAGRLGQARHRQRHHRAALGPGDRNPPDHAQGPSHHASRHCLPRAGRPGRAGGRRPCRRRSWNGRSASRAR